MPKHRHQEFLRFMNTVARTTAKDLDIHVIFDNYAMHKHPNVKQWLHRFRNEPPPIHLDSHRPLDPQEGEQSQEGDQSQWDFGDTTLTYPLEQSQESRGEGVVIVASTLPAFSIDAWWEERSDAR